MKRFFLLFVASYINLLGGCGQNPATISTYRAGTTELNVESAIKSDGGVIVGTTLHLTTAARFTDVSPGDQAPVFTVSVLNAAGEVVVKPTPQKGESIDWGIELPYGDGEYTAIVEVTPRAKDGPWQRRFRIDTTPPDFRIVATIDPQGVSIGRRLLVRSIVSNEIEAQCRGTVQSGIAPAEGEVPTLVEEQILAEEASDTGKVYRLPLLEIPDDFPNAINVRMKCEDQAGNSSTLFEVIRGGQPTFGVSAAIDAKQGIPAELAAATPPVSHAFVTASASGGATQFNVLLDLLDPTTATVVSDGVVEREKQRLKIYLTDFEVTDLAVVKQLEDAMAAQAAASLSLTDDEPLADKNIYVRKLFDKTIPASIPSTVVGSKTLYVALVQLREATQEEELMACAPLQIYVQPYGIGLEYQWLQEGIPLVAASEDANISGKVRIRPKDGTGAPRDGFPIVESTIDGQTWQATEATNWQPDGTVPNVFTFNTKYPYGTEQIFRLRLRGNNLAAVETVSSASHRLIAATGFAYSAPTTTPCLGVNLHIQLQSRFACKLGTKYYLPFVVENLGNAVPAFSTVSPCSAGSTHTHTNTCISYTRNLSAERRDARDLTAAGFKNLANATLNIVLDEAEFNARPVIKFLLDASHMGGTRCTGAPTEYSFNLEALDVIKEPAVYPCQ